MPELPEVETARRAVDRAARGKVVRTVWVAEDRIVFEGVPADRFVAALTGRRITGSDRWGKHYWLAFEGRPWLVFHFGMTGWTHVYADDSERPKFLKLELELEDGTRIGYRDPRRIGRVRLRDNPREEPPISELGFDPLHGLPPGKVFREEFARRKAPIKAVLLDQSFSAGVGNWIADEVLYQAGIDPRRRADTLTASETARVRAILKKVIGLAVKVGSDDARFPRTWLFHYRWGKTRGAVDGRGRAIRFTAVGGRTTAWVPDVQR